uniref:Uncharacterized protein n=1 Tax=Lygus hesperus TaxID=30085 RepID=A0A146L971_LYGHE
MNASVPISIRIMTGGYHLVLLALAVLSVASQDNSSPRKEGNTGVHHTSSKDPSGRPLNGAALASLTGERTSPHREIGEHQTVSPLSNAARASLLEGDKPSHRVKRTCKKCGGGSYGNGGGGQGGSSGSYSSAQSSASSGSYGSGGGGKGGKYGR